MADILQAAQQQINDDANKITGPDTADPPVSTGLLGMNQTTPLVGSAVGVSEPPPPAPPMEKKDYVSSTISTTGFSDKPIPPPLEPMQSPPLPVPPPEPMVATDASPGKQSPTHSIDDAGISKPSFTSTGSSLSDVLVSPSAAKSSYGYIQNPSANVSATDSPSLPYIPPPPDLPGSPPPSMVVPPPPKKSGKKGLIIAVILLLAAAIPVGVYFVSQQGKQVADVRIRAGVCCEGGTCNNGWSFGRDENYGGGSCDDRNKAACDSGTTPGSGGIKEGGGACSGSTPPPGDRCPNGDGGQPGESCDSIPNKCDKAGGCNKACGARNEEKTIDGVPNICDVPNGYCRSEFSCRPTGTGYHLTCVNNACVNQLCPAGQASCSNDCSINANCQSSSTPTPTNPPTGNCAGALQSCTPGATSGASACCSGQNLVCQTPRGGGQAVCQQTTPNQCPGGTCNRFIGFKCTALTDGECHDNPKDFQSFSAAAGYATGCGQADQACKGGTRDGLLCGDFQIFNSTCGVSSTVTPTQPPAPPRCDNGALFKVYDAIGNSITTGQGTSRILIRPLQEGETVILATDKASQADHARFRLQGVTACDGTEWCNSNPADNTATEFRRKITIPANYGGTSGVFEADLCDANNSCQ